MKTTTELRKNNMINAKIAKDLLEGIAKILPIVYDFAKFNEYDIITDSGKLNGNGFQTGITSLTLGKITNLSLNKRKELRNWLWSVEKHPSIKKVNRLFHFMKKHFDFMDFKITYNQRELTIKGKRKIYVDAREAAKKAYVDYKNEKGDFYNIRLSNGQKIQ